uniref:FAM3 metabolism regulating signaling molecule D n=1 Tax=Ficedula albicollis TaxID=59894 RepID=A0A803V694_FICAL
MVSWAGTEPFLPTARVLPSPFPRKSQASGDPIPGTVAEPKAHPSVLHGEHSHSGGCKHGTNPAGSQPAPQTPPKQHSHHCSSYNTLREDQSILQGTPGLWPGKAQSHPSANSLCSVFNFNLSGTTGQLLKTDAFDMYSGDITKLQTFLQGIKRGTLVLVASYDDPATKMNDKVRAYFTELGSSDVATLGFRDNWVFLGAKGLMNKSPFEKHIKNDKETNKYDGWPELLEMEGCAPRKMD